jgi:hypothetical protein
MKAVTCSLAKVTHGLHGNPNSGMTSRLPERDPDAFSRVRDSVGPGRDHHAGTLGRSALRFTPDLGIQLTTEFKLSGRQGPDYQPSMGSL